MSHNYATRFKMLSHIDKVEVLNVFLPFLMTYLTKIRDTYIKKSIDPKIVNYHLGVFPN